MAGETKVLTFSEGVTVTAPVQSFLTSSALEVYADDAAYVTAKGSAAELGDCYINSTDKTIHYYGVAWVVVEAAKNNLVATVAPAVGDDSGDGYSVGSKWFDVTNDKIYIAIDVTPGAAIWHELITILGTQVISGTKTFSAITTVSNTTTSTTKDTGALVVEGGVGIEENLNVGGNVIVTGDLTVNGTNTVLNTTTLEVEDANIIINNGGNKAAADSIAGITVEMSDNTHGSIKYLSTLTSRFKIGDLSSEVEVATISGAQVITNKDIDGGAASNTVRMTVPKNTRANLEALTRKEGTIVYDTDSDIFLGDDGVSLASLGGSGGGEYDFLADRLIANFNTYDDGDVAIPVNGTGGSASYITVAESPAPITNQEGVLNLRISKANGASARGEGVSVDFSTRGIIDRATMRTCKINFLSSTNYIDNAFGVYLYDVTNSVLIYPSDTNIKASVYASLQQFEFQLSPDSDSYRLILHCQDATVTTAYDLDMTVKIVEQKLASGAPVTDMVAWTPTGSWTSNTTYTGAYCRNGDRAIGWIRVTTSGAPTSAALTVNLPFSIDTVKRPAGFNVGTVELLDSNTSDLRGGMLSVVSATVVRPYVSTVESTFLDLGSITQAAPFTFAANDYVDINFDLPVSGWSSNVVMSSDAGNRTVAARMKLITANQTIPSNTWTEIVFNSSLKNSTGNITNTSTGRLTAPESGTYLVAYDISYLTGATAPSVIYTKVLINGATGGVAFNTIDDTTNSETHTANSSTVVDLLAGQYISVWTYSGGEAISAVYNATDDFTAISLVKVGTSQTIAASEKVYAAYNTNTASAMINNTDTIVVFEDKISDSHNAYNSTTGVYTCPKSGQLSLSSMAQLASNAGWTAGDYINLSMVVNSTVVYIGRQVVYATLNPLVLDVGGSSTGYPVNKGDTISIKVLQNSGGDINLSGVSSINRFELKID